MPLNPTEVLQKIAHGPQGVAVIEGDELHLVLPDGMSQIGATTPVINTGSASGPRGSSHTQARTRTDCRYLLWAATQRAAS
ncbi:hypothetical protein ACFRQM_51660 [Streptomyces sp. NPDC056831]|uniref:hypothetical protein n=1 Tax=Streptomyces sp. NPDC056831 TaxID=3345954 RepID=UPI0036ABE333